MVDICNYNRIIIVGSGGSGKSWLSKQIAGFTGHPLYHLDNEFWRPNWVIFLDINRLACAISAIKRHGKKRSDLPNYLDESGIFNKDFFEFIKWIWSYPKTGRKTVMALHEKYPDKPFLHIKTRREATRLVKNWND